MRPTTDFELPPDRQADLRKAVVLAWITIVYLCSDVVLMYLVMGSSQAMKASLFEDLLNLLPPIGLLIGLHVRKWPANARYPYGYHNAMEVAFLAASLALLALGGYLLYESVMKLVHMHRPTIGTFELFGWSFWQGWIMLPVLGYSLPIALVLGHKKMPLARSLNIKALHSGAKMNKADWTTTSAAMAGVLGIALGFWWADAAAAGLIALDIIYDGYRNTRSAVGEIMERVPETVDTGEVDPLPGRVAEMLRAQPWVRDARVRMREVGSVFYGEAFVVPDEQGDVVQHIEQATRAAYDLDWRLHDLVIHLTSTVEGHTGDIDTGHGRDDESKR